MLPGGALLGRSAIGRRTTGAERCQGGAQPARRAARTARCQRSARLSRTFARILGQECTENGLCRPPFRHILARKDGGSTRRPPYQRNDYISWIERPKREATRQAHLAQMLDELRAGNRYKGMPWPDTARPKGR
ncbi:YdeI/OmpD-associated family protein [Enorma massiliensis]|uniref:YdeI/OmpD-associated family protein n=1 Tax=Enorma massiliensis TaxID=1472761 RepID=UPI003AB6F5D5